MSGLYAPSELELSLGINRAPENSTEAAGLSALNAGDIYGMQQQVMRSTAALQSGVAPPAPPQPEAQAYFSRSTGKMFAGGMAFDERDVQSAFRAAQQFTAAAGARPPQDVADWQPLSRAGYEAYLNELRAPRGIGENLILGARGAVGGFVSGIGRGAEMLGATTVGPAIAGVGEAITGQDEFDRQRSALIQQSNSLVSNILDAAVQGITSLGISAGAGAVGGIVGGAIGGPAGAAAGATTAATAAQAGRALAAARGIGAVVGLGAASFPQQLNTFYEAAQNAKDAQGRPVYDVNDPNVQLTIAGAALGTSLLDVIAPGRVAFGLSRALTEGAQQAGTQALTGLARAKAVGGSAVRSGFEEAATEATQTLAERAVFDPEFRRQLNAEDWKALGPYIVNTYGQDVLIAAGAGALLGGGFGGAGRFIETRGKNSQERNILDPTQTNAIGTRTGSEQFGPPPPEQFGPPRPGGEAGFRVGDEQFGPPTPGGEAGFRTGAEQFGPGTLGGEAGIRVGTEQFGPTEPAGDAALRAQRRLTVAAQQQQAQQDIQSRMQANASAPRPDVLYDPADPGTTQRAMQSLGVSVEEVLGLRDPSRAMVGAPVTLRDVNEAAALLGRTRGSGAPAARPTPVVPPNMAQAMQDAGLTVEDVMAARNRLRSGPVTYEDVRIAARRKGVELPVRLARGAEPAPAAPVAEAAPAVEAVVPTPDNLPPALAPLVGPATPLKKGKGRATQVRQVEQGGVSQRAGAGGPVPSKGQDRLKQAKEQGGGGKAGGRNLTRQGRAAAQEVTPAPAAEVAAQRPFSLAAPSVTERAVPSAAPSVEAAAPNTFDRQITQATTSADPAAQLRTLKNELIMRRDAAADAGRSTTELTQAIGRIDTMVAEGVIQANDPQARWATTMDDEGRGFNELSQAGKNAWAQEVARGTPLTRELAADLKQRFPSEDTTKGVAEVSRLMGLLERADDSDRVLKIMDRLDALTESSNDAVAQAAREALGRDRDAGRFSLAGWNTRQGAINADGKPATPMAVGRVRMLVNNFVAKLATKPKVTVVANQQELQRANPALYQQAVAARPQGDFATAEAAGYSFGDGNVIIFTDRIVNEQHLRFVLAHETFGHFGMRGIMPASRFDALMENIYESDTQAKASADAAMEVRGLSKAEAVEEYLSDYAAMLQTSTAMRVWNAIKGFLDRLGVKFGDSATRYFLDQSRRYVRQGAQGVTFDAQAVGQRMYDVEYGVANPGRFSPSAAIASNSLSQVFLDRAAAWPTTKSNWDEVAKTISSKTNNLFNRFEDFKAKYFSLTNFRSQDNPGLYQVARVVDSINNIAMSVKNTANDYMRFVLDASPARQAVISEVMYDARDFKINTLDKSLLRGDPLVIVGDDGVVVPNASAVKKLFDAGLLTKEQIREGFKFTRTYEGNDGTQKTEQVTVPGRPKFSDDDYTAYVKARESVAYTELEVLRAEYNNLLLNRTVSYKELRSLMRAGKLEAADRAFVDAFVKQYGKLYTKDAVAGPFNIETPNPTSMANAEEFLKAVNAAFIGTDTDRNAAIKNTKFFDNAADADAFIAQMMDVKGRRKDRASLPEARAFDLQDKVKEIFLTTYAFDTKQRVVRRNLATGYTPAMREGDYQTRVRATVNGKPVELKHSHQELMTFAMFADEDQSLSVRDQLNTEFKDKTYKLLAKNMDGEFVPTDVTLEAVSERAVDAVAADPQLQLPTFLYGLSRFGISVEPKVMEKIVTALSRQGSGYRSRLEYSGTPGFDRKAGVAAVARLNETRASIVAETLTRQQLRELMDRSIPETRALWDGNKAYVAQLKQELDRVNADPSASREAKADAQSRYTEAAAMDRKTNPEGRASKANAYYNQASNLLQFLKEAKHVDDQNIGVGEIASRVRTMTVIAQMGLSVAQGALNLQSPYTNWMPYMASRNSKTGFGGGFSFPKVISEYHKALAQVGVPGIASKQMNEAAFYDRVAQSKDLQAKHRLTADEAKVIAKEIREGKLIPAQTNSMLAMSRGYISSPWLLRTTELIMSPFNLTEQAARRAAFLSAFRLYRERAVAAGMEPRAAIEDARARAVDSLDLTLGNYSVANRPAAWRTGITSFLFMYKTYPITTVQLFSRLSRPGQLAMFFGMFMLSGMTGLPFAEDLEDLIDTIAQKLGYRQGSIRAEVIRFAEDVMPGSSAYLLKGFANSFLGIDVASRTSSGNILPGTGIGLAGANVAREMGDILGPAVGFIKGVYDTAVQVVRYPTTTTTTIEDIARNSPVTFLRMMGDSYAYYQSGAVIDRRGYVVSPNMNEGTILARMMGFYPASAAAQYDIVRIAQRELDYQKEVVAAFRQRWIKATLRGDYQGAADTVTEVNEWNSVARGTPMEIRNFMTGNTRALREARRGAGERALRAAPQAAQEDIRGYIDALTE